jgi:hypothetical protein
MPGSRRDLWRGIMNTAGLVFRRDRTLHGTIGAVHAAVSCLRLQDRSTTLAVIEILAGIRGHRLRSAVAALRTGNRRLQDGVRHKCNRSRAAQTRRAARPPSAPLHRSDCGTRGSPPRQPDPLLPTGCRWTIRVSRGAARTTRGERNLRLVPRGLMPEWPSRHKHHDYFPAFFAGLAGGFVTAFSR